MKKLKSWQNFGIIFIALPLIFTLLVALLGHWQGMANLLADITSNRSDNIIPERMGHADNLPSGDLTSEFIPAAIKMIISLVGLGLVIVVIYSGFMQVSNFGDEEKVKKAHRMLYWALVGIALVALSYALVYGITNISWTRGS